MSAVWNLARSQTLTFPVLDHDIDVDVAIIGGGATGLAAALILTDAGERVAVLEAHRIGYGNTGRSTGNLYATVSMGLAKLRRKWKQETVNQVVKLRRQALNDIQENVKRLAIDCQFERRPLHFCLPMNKEPMKNEENEENEENNRQLEEEYQVSVAAGLTAEIIGQPPGLGMPVRRALRIEDQAQYNPLRYCDGLANAITHEGGTIYENSPVTSVDAGEGKVITPGGVVRAGHLVFATHTPKGINMLQAEMEVYREHGIAALLKSGGDYPQGIFWMQDGFHSVRSYHYQDRTYLVVIGSKHPTGHDALGEGYHQQLEEYARRHYAIDSMTHRWSAQQFLPADLLPYIGRSAHDNVYVATGYAADGLVWSEVAAQLISHQILGRKDPDSELLTPRRFTPAKSAKGWLETNTKVAKHLSTDRFKVTKQDDLSKVPAGEGMVLKIAGDTYAVYRSPEGQLSTLSPICSHMKCMVHWNGADKSWDCPCHGSRFTTEGDVIEGPAYRPLEKRRPPV